MIISIICIIDERVCHDHNYTLLQLLEFSAKQFFPLLKWLALPRNNAFNV